MKRLNDWLVSFALALPAGIVLTLSPARVDADPGQRPAARASARTNINGQQARPAGSSRSKARPSVTAATSAQAGGNVSRDRVANINRNSTRDVNRDISRDHNVNVNHDVNINHHVDVHHHDHDHWDDWDDSGWDDHPFATAAAVTAGVAVTSAIIGSIVYSVPPSCVQVIVNNMAYQQCGNTWYLPQYSGTTVQYVVVTPPR
jgi:hypothetical protein